MKRIFSAFLALTLLLAGCAATNSPIASGKITEVVLTDAGVTVDGQPAAFDGKTSLIPAVYTANDILFYPTGKDFKFGAAEAAEMHEQAEADAHTVVHITSPGTYRISGTLSNGQIAVDLGERAEDNPNAVVTLLLDGANITCTVAPAIIFYNVYECGSDDEEDAQATVDTAKAGANIVIADGSENTVNGSYVARIYESYELSEDGTQVEDYETLHKYDGAVYSKMSMNVYGEKIGDGVLNINAENEGLDTELHLTVHGGNININSGNDGINTNEDGVSVTTVNGGVLSITVNGSTGEGDGIDSNGWLVINGGTVIASACDKSADSGIDSDLGIHLNGGMVYATGNMLDRISESAANYAVFNFSEAQAGGEIYTLKDADGNEVLKCSPQNSFTVLLLSSFELKEGIYTLWRGDTQLQGAAGGFGGRGGTPPAGNRPDGEMPKDFDPSNLPEDFDPSKRPERGERPSGMTPPDGEAPQRPDGARGENMPMPSENLTEEFAIKDGGNYFSFVSKTN